MTATRASVRRHVRIACPPDDAWAYIGDPARLPEWFPGIDSATVDGTMRVITTGSGIPMPEQILSEEVPPPAQLVDLEQDRNVVFVQFATYQE